MWHCNQQGWQAKVAGQRLYGTALEKRQTGGYLFESPGSMVEVKKD